MEITEHTLFKFNSAELNQRILSICNGIDQEAATDVDLPFEPIPNSGKTIHYWGWMWRIVDFDAPIVLCTNHQGEHAGFCQNNMWNYPEFTLTAAQALELRQALEVAVGNPTRDNLTTVWGVMQNAIPRGLPEAAVRERVYA